MNSTEEYSNLTDTTCPRYFRPTPEQKFPNNYFTHGVDWTLETRAITVTVYVVMFVVAVVGNSLVIAAVYTVRSMRTTMNLYLVNLAIADLLVAVVFMVTKPVILFAMPDYPFPSNWACKLLFFLFGKLSVKTSLFSVFLVTIDPIFWRYE